jgi:hypothetical protein
MLDSLHAAGVEIVSPEFRNNRALADNLRIIPSGQEPAPIKEKLTNEAEAFDKAEEAASLEMLRTTYKDLEASVAEEKTDEAKKKQLELRKERLKEIIARKESEAATRD